MGKKYFLDEPIAAIATALVPSALGIVRVSGKDSIRILSGVFSRPEALLEAPGNTLVHGWIQKNPGEKIDETLVAVYRAPKSFTGEESAEIICHGGVNVVTGIFSLLKEAGFRQAEGGEFSFRAFANGKTDLSRAEAIREIIDSKSDEARDRAISRLSGTLYKEIKRIKEKIIECLASLEVQIDYPEDELAAGEKFNPQSLLEAAKELKKISGTWKSQKLYQDGAKVVLCGKTNAGKSSLFNILVKEDRAIVSDIHGTTRDWLENWTSVKGIPVRLFDTAGIRETEDKIEEIGVSRSKQLAEEGDLILYLADGRDFVEQTEADFINTYREKMILVWNKTDAPDCRDIPPGWIGISTKTGNGVEALCEAVFEKLTGSRGENFDSGTKASVGSLRQKEAVERAATHSERAVGFFNQCLEFDVIAQEMQEALEALGEITGETVAEDILGDLFSRFCVGK